MKNDIGLRLKELRLKNKYSQEDIANICFVSRQAVSRWETNKNIPDYELLIKLSEIYKVKLDYILLGEDKNTSLKELINNIYKSNKIKNKLIIMIVLLITVFSIIFTIMNYNQTRIYEFDYNNEDISCSNGLLVLTSKRVYFKGCKPIVNNYEITNEEIDQVEFYYYHNNTKRLLFSGGLNSTDFIWKDDKSIGELFDINDVLFDVPKIKISIKTNKNEYDGELNIKKSFSNSI